MRSAGRASTEHEGPGRAQRSEHARSHSDEQSLGSSPKTQTKAVADGRLGDAARTHVAVIAGTVMASVQMVKDVANFGDDFAQAALSDGSDYDAGRKAFKPVRTAMALTGAVLGARAAIAKPTPKSKRTSPCNCFAGDTLVATPNGPVPIATLVAGDLVLSRDEASGAVGYRPILAVHVAQHQPLITLAVETTSGTTEAIRTTPGHPFWLEGAGWTHAVDLELGAAVPTAGGATALIAGAWSMGAPQHVQAQPANRRDHRSRGVAAQSSQPIGIRPSQTR